MSGLLVNLSSELAGVVEKVAPSVVRVDDGTRLTATGVLWAAGVIVTTSHGVERDEDLAIELHEGSRFQATLVGRDPDTDIAVLRAETGDAPALQRAAPDAAQVGHLALALGRPGTSGLQATIGILSARMDSQHNGRPEYILHTDALFYPGFSGGPLVNMNGEMVGLNNLMYGRGKSVALGVSAVAHVAEALLTHGRIQRGYLGVRVQSVEMPAHLVKSLSLSHASGLLVAQVEPDSPAEKGGLLLGDTILRIQDRDTPDVDTLRSALRSFHAGQTAVIQLLRGGVRQSLNVTLTAEN